VTLKIKTLTAAFIVLIALALAVVSIGATRRLPIKPHLAQDSAAKSKQETRSLKEKAKETRNFRDTQSPKSTAVYADLAGLANQSTAVIIGTPQRNISVLSSDGRSISLDYAVRVEYVYKGKLQPGNTITVSLPGGKVKFDDGTTAEFMTPWFKKMQNGKTYALFLQPRAGKGQFVTTGEAQGVFEIPTAEDDRTVKSHSGIQGHSVRKYDGQDVKTFLRELRQVTGKPLKG
jgi:hypothetical protein